MSGTTQRQPRLSRRRFLQVAALTGAAVAVPTVAGGVALWQASSGETPPQVSPYLDRAAWRWSPDAVARPILVLTGSSISNPFGPYLAEILSAEGLNSFYLGELAALTAEAARQFPVLLLAESEVSDTQRELLVDFVTGGGRLIAFRPDARLAEALGFKRTGDLTAEGDIQLAPDTQWAEAMISGPLQFHGEADHYAAAEGLSHEVVAWLAGEQPAILARTVGAGRAVVFVFDLARSVALTRQGNPAWANQARASRDGNVRAQDMLADWVDLERLSVPQADEQMRLLSRLITDLLSDTLPLPRLWYFPSGAPGLLIATGDSHQNPAAAIEDVLTRVEQRGGRMSVYYTPPVDGELRRAVRRARGLAAGLPVVGDRLSGAIPTPTQIAAWLARGHEFGMHPYVEDGLELGWARYWQEFTGMGYGPVPPTVRTHRILWTGWAETARTQAAHGIGLNLDYYHYGTFLQTPEGAWAEGYITGSGLPMRFVDEQGRVLNVFQQLTHLVDEHLMKMPWGSGWVDLKPEAALEVSRRALERATRAPGWAALGAQFHLDPFAFGGEWAENFGRWLDGTLDLAAEYGVPVWSAAEWLNFIEARDAATFDELLWRDNRLSFRLNVPEADGVQLAVMAPLRAGATELREVSVDGQPLALGGKRRVAGIDYGWVVVDARPHTVEVLYA
ncbi:MAG: twin-arginine translocation signal domain-containing protein [Anaerolineales bacterium]